ncbi:MAG: holo-ACP synthase [Planctomycetota bacterium]
MNVVAHGIDLVEITRVARLLKDHPERAKARLFTLGELSYCEGKKGEHQHLAARFAAKEAVLKALGCGWSQGVAWTDVEVTRAPSGEPGVKLEGRAAEIAAERGITDWRLSLTHTAELAQASAIALGS